MSAPSAHSKPLFLLSNDDGVHAPGLNALLAAVADLGEVVVAAPHVERSASSHAITIAQPLRVEEIRPSFYAVEGSPADCIMLACKKLLHRKPTWVLSGINRGGNLGIDTLYSGTVGAAMEGAIGGLRAMAISSHSLKGRAHDLLYETAGQVVRWLLKHEELLALPAGRVLNVNVPSLPFNRLRGIRMCGLGRRIYEDAMYEGVDPRGRPYYWIGGGGEMSHDIPESDCVMIDNECVTLTVLQPSLVDGELNEGMKSRLDAAVTRGFAPDA